MQEPDVTVILPTIRTHLLDRWYNSLSKSISRHTYEVCAAGPFEVTSEMQNFHFSKTFRNPTASTQLASASARGRILIHSVDDALFLENAISDEIDRYDGKSIVGMRYREGIDYSGESLPDNYWYAYTAYPHIPTIQGSWIHCVHFMMPRNLFMAVGGFDCNFHYLNHATHDLLFRLQYAGVKSYLSRSDITTCSWQPERTGDHGSIHDAQTLNDAPLFYQKWRTVPSLKVDFDNWKSQPEVWSTRFKGNENSYSELEHK